MILLGQHHLHLEKPRLGGHHLREGLEDAERRGRQVPACLPPSTAVPGPPFPLIKWPLLEEEEEAGLDTCCLRAIATRLPPSSSWQEGKGEAFWGTKLS